MIIFSSNFLPVVHEDHLRSLSVVVVRLPSGILATFPARTIEKLVFLGFVGFLLIFFWFSVNLFEFLVLVTRVFCDLFLVHFMLLLLLFFSFCMLYKDTDDIFT